MKTLFAALTAAALVGCAGLQPVGPLANHLPKPKTPAPAAAAKADPTPPPAVKPTPPTALVSPNDVSASDPHLAAARLTNELSVDGKPPTTGPVTVEVSRVPKGGPK